MYAFLSTNPDRIAITTSTAGCNNYAGVNEIEDFGKYVNLYPNPASNTVKLSLNNLAHSDFSYEIYNSNGQLISASAINYLYSEINISDLSSGLYFVKVFNNYNTITKRLVVTQ